MRHAEKGVTCSIALTVARPAKPENKSIFQGLVGGPLEANNPDAARVARAQKKADLKRAMGWCEESLGFSGVGL